MAPASHLYRRYAADCVRVAQQVKNPTDRATLLQMAKIWHDMAEKAERSESAQVQGDNSDHR